MDEVCQKLDDLAIRNLELSDDFIKINLELESRMKEGWFHLAKARYLMGFNTVSSLQIDERNCDSLTRVEVTSPDSISTENAPIKFDIRSNDDKGKLRGLTKIFGVLTPSNLKVSQDQFVKCLALSCELASIKEELKSVEKEYENFLKQKATLMKV